MVSTIDNISNGRVEFGIGAGWHDEEYYAYGYEFPPAKIRIKQLAEAVQVIKSMWTQERANFSGNYYSINDAVCNPYPVQKPRPPLWIGGSGNMLINVVAKYGDGCNFGIGPRLALTPKKYRERVSYLEGRCMAIGREPKSVRKSFSVSLVVGKNKEDVKRGVREAIAEISTHASARRKLITALNHPSYLVSGFLSLVGLEKPKFMITGTPEECADMLREFSDLGVELFMFNMPNLRKRMHSLELLMDRVAPAVK